MRKTILLAAILIATFATAHTHSQSSNFFVKPNRVGAESVQTMLGYEKGLSKPSGKCDAITRIAVRNAQNDKVCGLDSEMRFLAKVNRNFDARQLKRQGIVLGSKAGNIVTLRLTPNRVHLLDSNADILQYCIADPIYPTVNNTRIDTRSDSVQNGYGIPQAYTGKDVIIGITDWGFDYMHPNFNNNGADNRRVLRAWDQFKLSGPAPEGFDYGTEFATRSQMIEVRGDTAGLYGYATHGTHVAGIAAGRGVDSNYVGQAPYANLLFCSFHLNSAAWLDAVAWMKDVAKAEGKRLVVNNSWGMYTLGPIDGTSLVSQAIDNLSDSGVVFVTSAGNCGNDYFHISKTFASGVPDTLRSLASYYGGQEIGQGLVMWGEPGKSFETSFAMVHGSDSVCFRWIGTADGDIELDSALVCGSDNMPFRLIVEQANIYNGRPHIYIDVAKNSNYEIHVAVTAQEGTVHVWNMTTLANGAGNMGSPFTHGRSLAYTEGNNDYGIGEPACAESCIAVAAHTPDRRKPNGDMEFGPICGFSSHGPIIDGRHKPDVSAPGMNVCSSLSSLTQEYYTPVMTYRFAGRDYVWARMSGTSMSCPAVTGIVALMLEANPNLSPRQVREILSRTARNDAHTGPLHDCDSVSDTWGWGKANALAAVNEALAHVDIRTADPEWFAKSLQLYPNPAADRVTLLTGRHTPETVCIYSIDGRLMMSQKVVMESSVDISDLPHGVYIVKCGTRTARLLH